MEKVRDLLQAAVKRAYGEDIAIELTRPDEQFGDFATNIALQLSKKAMENPRAVAEKIISELQKEGGVAKAEVAGPGFLNITLSDDALWQAAQARPGTPLSGKTVVVEYSDPNPFKVLHAGHLYTSLVGDAIAKIIEAAGAQVKRVNFGGDVGLHVAKTMWSLTKDVKNANDLNYAPDELLEFISRHYVNGNNAYEKDEQAKKEIIDINQRVYELHETGDRSSDFAQIYWKCWQGSYDGFKAFYDAIGMVPFDKYYPESVTTPLGIKTVQEGLEKGVFERSEGAVVFRGEQHGLHTRVFLNSNGLPTYEAKDLGLAQQKWNDYQFDLSVMITGNDIVEYMKVVLAALQNFHPEIAERTRHLTHGMVKLAGGIKMSSRKGNILRAQDILGAAAAAMQHTHQATSLDTILAAVRYAFLKNRIGGDVMYNPEESVALEGNSGPYLQYAHARARSIIAKATAQAKPPTSLDAAERSLVRKLGEYPEVVEHSMNELLPHYICTYLYELAQIFNRFYEKNRIVGDTREAERLALVTQYADTLKGGLDLLNISAPERM